MSSTSIDKFISFFLICMPLISSCLITLARITDTMLNKSDKGRHLCLPPDLRGKTFSVSSLNMMLATDFL